MNLQTIAISNYSFTYHGRHQTTQENVRLSAYDGDFILLKPPFKLNTLALWLFPFIFFVLGIF